MRRAGDCTKLRTKLLHGVGARVSPRPSRRARARSQSAPQTKSQNVERQISTATRTREPYQAPQGPSPMQTLAAPHSPATSHHPLATTRVPRNAVFGCPGADKTPTPGPVEVSGGPKTAPLGTRVARTLAPHRLCAGRPHAPLTVSRGERGRRGGAGSTPPLLGILSSLDVEKRAR